MNKVANSYDEEHMYPRPFLCTNNSARSQMAETLYANMRRQFSQRWPGTGVNPFTIQVMRELG
jgi:protein-tyrosine-phosphatase